MYTAVACVAGRARKLMLASGLLQAIVGSGLQAKPGSEASESKSEPAS